MEENIGNRLSKSLIKPKHIPDNFEIMQLDFDKTYYPLIEEGVIYAAIGQDPFGQGHDPIIYLYNYLVTKEKPESEVVWTRTDVITQHNVMDLI